MKGLLKGLRYISEIFEADDEKEPEIQIGAPTDVKHVAHIGCDGPSSNPPSWMNEFHGSSDAGSSELKGSESSMGSPTRRGKSKQKKQGSNNSINTQDRERKARRSKNSGTGSESPAQDPRAKKDRKKKRASNRDLSDNDEESKGNGMRLKENFS